MTTSTIDRGPSPDADDRALVIDGLPGHFVLFFQPEFDLATLEVGACEALLRWWHPEFGLLRPGAALHQSRWDDVLESAEDWAVAAVVRQLHQWSEAGLDLGVALNVGRRQLRDRDLPRRLGERLDDAGIAPRRLAGDVPAGCWTTDWVTTTAFAKDLADEGLTVVADGVTAGARAGLQGSPISVCKIELHTSRRRRPGLHPSVEVAVELAHDLGAVAVAKAVERHRDLDALRAVGFDRAFGDVLRPPVAPEELAALVS